MAITWGVWIRSAILPNGTINIVRLKGACLMTSSQRVFRRRFLGHAAAAAAAGAAAPYLPATCQHIGGGYTTRSPHVQMDVGDRYNKGLLPLRNCRGGLDPCHFRVCVCVETPTQGNVQWPHHCGDEPGIPLHAPRIRFPQAGRDGPLLTNCGFTAKAGVQFSERRRIRPCPELPEMSQDASRDRRLSHAHEACV